MPSSPRHPLHPCDSPDFTEAIAAAQSRPAAWGTPTNSHAQAALAALSEAVSAVRAAQNSAEFTGLLATLRALGQRADAEALAAAQDFEAQPTLAQDAAAAQSAAAALQELSASVDAGHCAKRRVHLAGGGRHSADRAHHYIAGFEPLAGSVVPDRSAGFAVPHAATARMAGMFPTSLTARPSTPTFASVLELTIDPKNLEEYDLAQFQTWFGTKGDAYLHADQSRWADGGGESTDTAGHGAEIGHRVVNELQQKHGARHCECV